MPSPLTLPLSPRGRGEGMRTGTSALPARGIVTLFNERSTRMALTFETKCCKWPMLADFSRLLFAPGFSRGGKKLKSGLARFSAASRSASATEYYCVPAWLKPLREATLKRPLVVHRYLTPRLKPGAKRSTLNLNSAVERQCKS